MPKDRRYGVIKNLISGGYVTTIREIMDTLPKSTIAKDLGMHHQTFNKLLENPEKFTIEIGVRMAALFEVPDTKVIDLIYKQYEVDKKAKRKR
jgi:hypothetical protein